MMQLERPLYIRFKDKDSEKEKEAEGGGFGPNAYINGSAGSKISLTKDAGLLPPSPGHYLAPSTKV